VGDHEYIAQPHNINPSTIELRFIRTWMSRLCVMHSDYMYIDQTRIMEEPSSTDVDVPLSESLTLPHSGSNGIHTIEIVSDHV
jgi:hypothetical protein